MNLSIVLSTHAAAFEAVAFKGDLTPTSLKLPVGGMKVWS